MVAHKSMWSCLYRDAVNAARFGLGLAPQAGEVGPWQFLADRPILLGYSESLLPRPVEWGKNVHILGHLVHLSEEAVAPALSSFLRTPHPVVYICFGAGFNTFQRPVFRAKLLSECTKAVVRCGGKAVLVCESECDCPTEPLRGPNCFVLTKRPTQGEELTILTSCASVLCSGEPGMLHTALLGACPVCTLDFGRDDTPEAFWGGVSCAAGVGVMLPLNPKGLENALTSALSGIISTTSPSKTVAKAIRAKLMHESASGACALVLGALSQPSVSGVIPAPATSDKDPPSDSRLPAGFSFGSRAATSATPQNSPHVWRRGDDAEFKVRVGPNYKKNGRKEASTGSLYELVNVDLFKSPVAMEKLSDVIKFPSVERDTHHPVVPSMFVVNGSIPLESPSMVSPSTNGATLNAVFYFAIKKSTCDSLADLSTAAPAVRLLYEWCRTALDVPDMFARFKCIGNPFRQLLVNSIILKLPFRDSCIFFEQEWLGITMMQECPLCSRALTESLVWCEIEMP